MKKTLKWLLVGLFVALVLVCAGVPGLLWSIGGGTPTIAVDYTAKLNERASSIPEDERAWPLLRDAAIRLASLDEADMGLVIDPDRWAAESAELGEILRRISAERSLLIESSGMSGLGFVTSDEQPAEFWTSSGDVPPERPAEGGASPMLIGVLLPHLGKIRLHARVLNADAWYAAETGDGARFLEDVSAMLAISVFVEEHPILLSQLVGTACRAMAYERITETLGAHPELLSADQLAELAALLGNLHGGQDYRLDLDGERYFFLDLVQRMYTDDGVGNGEITAHGMGLLMKLEATGGVEADDAPPTARIASGAARLVASDRKTVVETFERFLESSETWGDIPLWERTYTESEDWERLEEPTVDPGRLLLSLMVPALAKAHLAGDRVNQIREATEAAVAVHRWRAETGEWPATLDALVPSYLPTVPIDSMVGEPLRYTPTGNGPLLYSVGMDRDDDGGRPAERAKIWEPKGRIAEKLTEDPLSHDGDWVILAPGADAEPD